MIRNMMEQQKDMHIPTELLPVCPHCGKPLTMNLRVLFLELGVGYNTPGIVKYSFWRMTAESLKATYACVNLGEACAPTEIIDCSICINADIGEVLKQL